MGLGTISVGALKQTVWRFEQNMKMIAFPVTATKILSSLRELYPGHVFFFFFNEL